MQALIPATNKVIRVTCIYGMCSNKIIRAAILRKSVLLIEKGPFRMFSLKTDLLLTPGALILGSLFVKEQLSL